MKYARIHVLPETHRRAAAGIDWGSAERPVMDAGPRGMQHEWRHR